ncbi:hypothetical protein EVAR_54229_1 [Eumeta japonica]|uniref:Uncharacterized protein n=1 Tax=Eumeta variegata TaxID=151549 RepID=A0A4C1Z169_EUMVA|nr:hypothetical protein EVAR_54229_1 [Eumeta japonica]
MSMEEWQEKCAKRSTGDASLLIYSFSLAVNVRRWTSASSRPPPHNMKCHLQTMVARKPHRDINTPNGRSFHATTYCSWSHSRHFPLQWLQVLQAMWPAH